ncbi:nucleoside triphosphate pyrophosphohydrolase [Halorubellus sp. PRR65]|uniref:nucleoside triphosphate pyrophosphohydrolase n=1 Tax=Halorubellus sp. PRR65 TaxID=3098148 RepID=UPI002B25C8F6|nr:nucleoside triphosphate pyrophosphohydrolase [Halorubellus sp. PRR65]
MTDDDAPSDESEIQDSQNDESGIHDSQNDESDIRESRRTEYVGAYDKLVRDDIPAVVRADGNRPVTRQVDGREYERYLARKLREEADEVVDAVAAASESDPVDDAETLDELADVHAVLEALVATTDHSLRAVVDRAREKAADRGGFEDGVVLERIDAPDAPDE